jgi:hypothetical protein
LHDDIGESFARWIPIYLIAFLVCQEQLLRGLTLAVWLSSAKSLPSVGETKSLVHVPYLHGEIQLGLRGYRRLHIIWPEEGENTSLWGLLPPIGTFKFLSAHTSTTGVGFASNHCQDFWGIWISGDTCAAVTYRQTNTSAFLVPRDFTAPAAPCIVSHHWCCPAHLFSLLWPQQAHQALAVPAFLTGGLVLAVLFTTGRTPGSLR